MGTDAQAGGPGRVTINRTPSTAPTGVLRKLGPDVPNPLVVVRAPTNGTVVSPGQTVDIKLDPAPDANIGEVLIFSRGNPPFASFTSLPATLHLTVPDEAAGDFPIAVISRNPAYGAAEPITITLRVVQRVALQSLKVEPDSVRFVLGEPGEESVLYVVGRYADGVDRDLTKSGTGTTYVSSGPAVVTVSKDGRLHAQGNGHAIVTVTNGSLSGDVAVTVTPDP